MSGITLTILPKKPREQCVVGGEAKNPPQTKVRNNFSWMDMAGLSWIFLDDPKGVNDFT